MIVVINKKMDANKNIMKKNKKKDKKTYNQLDKKVERQRKNTKKIKK